MKKILIFRTDRIGDFLISTPIFSSLKRNFPNSKIDIVCSDLNYNYVKTFRFFNNSYLYPKLFFKKIIFFFKLPSYDYILVLDGKKRSIYFSLFKSSLVKILFTPSKFIKRIFSFFFNKSYFINYNYPKIKLIETFLDDIHCNLEDSDVNFLRYYENENLLIKKISFANYVLLNFDEKWIYDTYLKSYSNIEPSVNEFLTFISEISKKNNLIISNGFKDNKILTNYNFLDYIKKKNNIKLENNIDIFELQLLIKNCNTIITCHGAPSHIASNYNKKIIDIIDLSEKDFFESYNFHFKNKIQIIRSDFKKTSDLILKNI